MNLYKQANQSKTFVVQQVGLLNLVFLRFLNCHRSVKHGKDSFMYSYIHEITKLILRMIPKYILNYMSDTVEMTHIPNLHLLITSPW